MILGGAGGWGGWNKPRCWREKALRGVNQNFSSYCFKPFKMIQCCPFYLLHWPLTQNTLVCARPHQKHINGMVFMTTLMRYSLEALLVSIDNPRIIFGLSGHPSSYRCLSNGVVAHVMMRRQLPLFQAADAKPGDICCHFHKCNHQSLAKKICTWDLD